jgi:inositol transport system ATP-binding protein
MDALRAGISMIHQELNLVPHMTVAENIWLGREPMKYGFVDHRQLARQTQDLLDKLNIRLSADRLVGVKHRLPADGGNCQSGFVERGYCDYG